LNLENGIRHHFSARFPLASSFTEKWDEQLEIAGPRTIDLMLDELIRTPDDKEDFL